MGDANRWMREMARECPLAHDDDLHGVLAIPVDDLARSVGGGSKAHRTEYLELVRQAAVERDPELATLGGDPDADVGRRYNAKMSEHGAQFLAHLRGVAPPPTEEPIVLSRIDRLWIALAARRDRGWAPIAAKHAWQDERIRRISRYSSSLRPRDVDLLTSDDLVQTEALDAVRTWEDEIRDGAEDRRVLVLLGATGVGKSLAAAWWATSARRSQAGVYVRMRDLDSQWTADFGRPSAVFAGWMREPMLVVDELGREHGRNARDRGAAILMELIDLRAGTAGLSTIVISNREKRDPRTGAGFVEHYCEIPEGDAPDARAVPNEPLLDRLRADCLIVEVAGESLRPGAL